MIKPIQLCLFLILSVQCFSQRLTFKSYNEAEVTGIVGSTKQNLQLQSAATREVNQPSSSRVSPNTTLVQNSSSFPKYWPDRVFVKLKNGQTGKLKTFKSKTKRPKLASGDKLNNALQRHKAISVSELPKTQRAFANRNTFEVVIEASGQLPSLMQELQALPEVEYVEPVPYYIAFDSPNDPSYVAKNQYALIKTKSAGANAIHTGSSKTLLAIVDDAVLISHPDLAANINLAKSYDVADQDSDPRPPSSGANKAGTSTFSHGTHCAGIAGSVTNNGEGIASISNNKISIIGVKCTRDVAPTSRAIEYATEGMIYAINQGARVISMSFGGGGYSRTVQNIINDATANGVVFVAAAGNDNTENKMYPAAYDNVISVASTDANDLKSSFSNYGTWVDISAPGSAILSTVTASDGTSGAYTYYNGTSMACPMVASLVAYMLSENPNLTPQAITQLLKSTADPLESVPNQSASLAGKLGGGRINAYRAIQAIKELSNTEAPQAITDLKLTFTGYTDVNIEWTAPDAGGSAASLYDIRYSTEPIDAGNFEAATKTKQNVFPAAPGTTQQLSIKDLEPGITYYIGIVAKSFYGRASPVSNIISASTLASPKLKIGPEAYTLDVDRTAGTVVSRNFAMTNEGKGAANYTTSIIPISGNNVLAYDKQPLTADNSIGLGGDSFISAAKFTADSRGFTLTHVQNFLSNGTTASNVPIEIRVLKGGNNPGNATLLTSQTISVSIPADGDLLSFPLNTPQTFAPSEVFWVLFVLPSGLDYPQGIDIVGPNPGTFFLGSADGSSYEDAQTLASFLANASLKIRAVSADWVTLNPFSGTLQPEQTSDVSLSINTATLPDGLYKMNLLVKSNDVFNPSISRPITLNVTGGQPKFVLDPSVIDFGTLFVGTSRTLKIKHINKGTATLNVKAEAVDIGAFSPTDFTLTNQGPFNLAPGKENEVSITFKPSKKESLHGTVSLSSNDPTATMVTVPVKANLVEPPFAAVSPTSLNFEVEYNGSKTQTQEITLQNKGEAELTYTLQPQLNPVTNISYDANRAADNYIGFGVQNPYIYIAQKFDVSTPSFNLTHVQNFFRTQTTNSKNIILRVYKGGSSPTAGTLVSQQIFNAPASASNGSLVTIPLPTAQQFKQGDVFWVVFYFDGINQPQGYHTNTLNPGRNFYSANGTNWFALESAGGSLASSTFVIKSLEMPQWLSVSPSSGSLPSGSSLQAKVLVNTEGLQKGKYNGKIQVSTNDPEHPTSFVEVNLQLAESPVAEFAAKLTEVLPGEEVSFLNTSKNADTYEWFFEGAEQENSTATAPTVVYKNPGKYKVSLKATSTETGRISAALVKENYILVSNNICQELNAPFLSQTVLATNDNGFIAGTNKAGDLAKANYFALKRPEAFVTGIKVKFGNAVSSKADAAIKIAVWDIDKASGRPSTILASKEVLLKDVAADVASNTITNIQFDAPVRLNGDFFAGVVLNTEAGTSVAIEHGTATNLMTAWSQDNQNSWKPLGEAWPDMTNTSLYIQPAITQTLSPLQGTFRLSAETVCVGEQVQLDASDVTGAVRFEWITRGSTNTLAAEAKSFVSYQKPGTYKIILKAYDDCSGVMTTTKMITVIELPKATIEASGPTTICQGDKVTLSAPIGEGNTYLWSTGAKSSTIEAGTAGTYSVQVTNASGCVSSDAIEVKVYALPVANITVIGSTTFCEGEQLVLTASEGSAYRWSNGATTRSITVMENGTYTVQVTNGNNCVATSKEVTTTVTALPAKPTLTRKDVILSSSSTTRNQWFFNNSPISGAIDNKYEIVEPGQYQVQVTNENNCVSEISKAITITDKDLITNLQVYPIPNDGHFTLAFTGLKPETISIRILDTVGKEIYARDKNMVGSRTVELGLSSVPAGIYLLHIQHKEKVYTHRIVIQH